MAREPLNLGQLIEALERKRKRLGDEAKVESVEQNGAPIYDVSVSGDKVQLHTLPIKPKASQ